MFNDVRWHLENSKSDFLDKVNDSFGNSILREVYEPIENDIRKLDFAWDEAEIKKMEIMALLIELRMIL